MSSGGGHDGEPATAHTSRRAPAWMKVLVAALVAVDVVLLPVVTNIVTALIPITWVRNVGLIIALFVGLSLLMVVLYAMQAWLEEQRWVERDEPSEPWVFRLLPSLREGRRRGAGRRWLVAGLPLAILFVTLVVVGALVLPRSGGSASPGAGLTGIDFGGRTYQVASIDVPEKRLLCEMQVIALDATNARAADQCGQFSSPAAIRSALVNGEIDMYWEYTGEAWTDALGQDRPVPGAMQQYEATRELDLRRNDIVWTAPTPFANTLAVVTKQGARTVSDFASRVDSGAPDGTVCVDPGFAGDREGLTGLAGFYGIRTPLVPPRVTQRNPGAIELAVVYGSPCAYGIVSSTDWQIQQFGLTVLTDDRSFFRQGNVANTLPKGVVDRDPRVVRVSDEIARRLDDATIRDLNGQVVSGGKPSDVAHAWLRRVGLIDR